MLSAARSSRDSVWRACSGRNGPPGNQFGGASAWTPASRAPTTRPRKWGCSGRPLCDCARMVQQRPCGQDLPSHARRSPIGLAARRHRLPARSPPNAKLLSCGKPLRAAGICARYQSAYHWRGAALLAGSGMAALFIDILTRVTLPIITLVVLGWLLPPRLKLDVGTLNRLPGPALVP